MPLRRRTKRDRSVARECDSGLASLMDEAKARLTTKFPTAQFGETYVEENRASCEVTDLDCAYQELAGASVAPARVKICNGTVQLEIAPSSENEINVCYKIGLIWAIFMLTAGLVTYWVLQNYNAGKL